MMTTTTPKPREGQVAGFPKEQAVMLTESNAYRAKSIRRTGTDEAPVLFHFRKRCMGMHSYVHTIEAADGTEREIRRQISRTGKLPDADIPAIWKTCMAVHAAPTGGIRLTRKSVPRQTSAAMRSSCVPT